MTNYDDRFSLANCIVSPLHYFTLSLKELAGNMAHNVPRVPESRTLFLQPKVYINNIIFSNKTNIILINVRDLGEAPDQGP